jgi:hypothetical protein
LEEITEKLMEKIIDTINQNVQDALKKLQDTKNKEHEKTQKQMNAERTSTNTKEKQRTLQKKEIHELKKTTKQKRS